MLLLLEHIAVLIQISESTKFPKKFEYQSDRSYNWCDSSDGYILSEF